jgi:hypothetical protein
VQGDGLNILVEEKYHLLQDLLRHFTDVGALLTMINGCPLLKESRKCMVYKTLLRKLLTLLLKMMKPLLKNTPKIQKSI